jgi:hypothetical protein
MKRSALPEALLKNNGWNVSWQKKVLNADRKRNTEKCDNFKVDNTV